MTPSPAPDRSVALASGRSIALDDRGAADGKPVLYLHGTPDTRLGRHPDDSIAYGLGTRLLAVDRPGLGDSDPDPTSTPISVADDLAEVLDQLGIETCGLVAWSAGSITALALAGAHPDRVTGITLVAPLIPADAYDDPHVLDGADDSRRLFADLLDTTDPDEIGRELAMWLVPPGIGDATARAMLAESLAAVADIDGAGDLLVASLRDSVGGGLTGLEREVAAQATPLGEVLDAVVAPVSIHVGARDTVAPPAMSHWLARRLGARMKVHEDAGHALAVTAWRELLAELPS